MKPSEYMSKFELVLRCKYSSNATIRNYFSCFKQFLRFSAGKDMTIEELIKNYMVWGIKSKEPKTINLHRAAVVCFFKLVKGIEIKTMAVPRKKEKKALPKIIPIEKIIEAIDKTKNIKHRLILMLFFDCGLRLCEIAPLKRKNILNNGKTIWLQNAKGNKERIIPVSESVQRLLSVYIDGIDNDDYIFGGVCKRTFSKVVTNAFQRVGVHATPHLLRHSFATFQIASGENPFKVQSWLGHNSIKTTQTYIHLSNQLLSEKKDLLNKNYMNFCS